MNIYGYELKIFEQTYHNIYLDLIDAMIFELVEMKFDAMSKALKKFKEVYHHHRGIGSITMDQYFI